MSECTAVKALYFINDPGAVEVSVLRRLPPAQACRGRPRSQRDLQGHQVRLVTAVAVQELLKQSPAQPSIHGELQEHRLGARIRGRFPAAQPQEELDEPDRRHVSALITVLVWMSGVFVEYLALDRSRSKVSSIRKPSSLKNRWFPLVVMPHFLEGFPPLISLKCSDSRTPPV